MDMGEPGLEAIRWACRELGLRVEGPGQLEGLAAAIAANEAFLRFVDALPLGPDDGPFGFAPAAGPRRPSHGR